VLGVVAVVTLYLSLNLAYLWVLTPNQVAASTALAADMAFAAAGAAGARFVALLIVVSSLGFLAVVILTGARLIYAMAADGVFLPALARLHPTYRSPWVAIVLQSAWSCILALTGRYEQLLNYVVFADWIFFGLTVLTVMTFRKKLPLSQRSPESFRVRGYPLVQILFVAVSAAVVASVVGAAPAAAAKGAVLIALGIPVYFWYARRTGGHRAGG
jgi:APA family basic amino acid/polyamine antiporter